jgi:hypothetical protein
MIPRAECGIWGFFQTFQRSRCEAAASGEDHVGIWGFLMRIMMIWPAFYGTFQETGSRALSSQRF